MALNSCAFATLAFECFLAPLCLVVPALTAGSPNAEASYRLFVGGGMLLSAVFRTPCYSYVRELFIATSWSEKQCMFSFLRSHRGSFSTWQSVPCSRVPSAPSSSPAPPATRWSFGTRFKFPLRSDRRTFSINTNRVTLKVQNP